MRRRPSTPRGRGALGERAGLGEAAPRPPRRQRPGCWCPGRAPRCPRGPGAGAEGAAAAGGRPARPGLARPGSAAAPALGRPLPTGPGPGRLPPQRRAWDGPAARPGPAPSCPHGERREAGPGRGVGAAGLAVTRRTPALKSCRINEGKSCLDVGAFRAWGRFWVFLAVRKPLWRGGAPCPPVVPGGSSRALPHTSTHRPLLPPAPARAASVSACPADTPPHPHPLSCRRCCFQIHMPWRAKRARFSTAVARADAVVWL